MSETPHHFIDDESQKEDGKFYIEFPLGGFREVSEEEYKARMAQEETEAEKSRISSAVAEALKNELDEAGYNEVLGHGLHDTHQGEYKKRLLEVLKSHNVKHIDDAANNSIEGGEYKPKYLEQSKVSEALIPLLLANSSNKNDPYLRKLDEIFSVCEAQAVRERVPIQSFEEILELFQIGHIDDLEYYLRFENLKKLDTICALKRIYTYGRKYEDKLPEGELPPEKMIIDYEGLQILEAYLKKHKNITINDIESNEQLRHEKFKLNYIQRLKEKLGYERVFLNRDLTLSLDETDLYEQMSPDEQDAFWVKMKTVTNYVSVVKKKWDMLISYEKNWLIDMVKRLSESKVKGTEYIKDRTKNDRRDSLRSSTMQKYYGFDLETLNSIVPEAKQIFMKDFVEYFRTLTFDNVNTNSFIDLDMINLVLQRWKDASKDYGMDNIPIDTIVQEGLLRAFEQGMEYIKQMQSDNKNQSMSIHFAYRKQHTFFAVMQKLGIQTPYAEERQSIDTEYTKKLEQNRVRRDGEHDNELGETERPDLNTCFAEIESYLAGEINKLAWEIHNRFYLACFHIFQKIHDAKNKSTEDNHEKVIEHVARNFKIDYVTQNLSQYSGQYPDDYLFMAGLSYKTPADIEAEVSKEAINEVVELFHRLENFKRLFFTGEVQNRLQANMLPGGKLQRVLQQQFKGKEYTSDEVVDYTLENISQIIIQDLEVSLIGRERMTGFFKSTDIMIREIISELIEEWKTHLGNGQIEKPNTRSELKE